MALLRCRSLQFAKKYWLAVNVLSLKQINNQLHTSSLTSSKFYELRTYSIQPPEFANFIKLSEEHIHLRTARSKLLGYWTSDLGGLNEVIHIWEYDNYEHRRNVRKALGTDKEWNEKYLSIMLKMLVKQENVVMYALPRHAIQASGEHGGFYELQTITSCPNKFHLLEEKLQNITKSHADPASTLIGIWKHEHGHLDTVTLLWSSASLDERFLSKQNNKDELTKLDYPIIIGRTSKVMLPMRFSPWQ